MNPNKMKKGATLLSTIAIITVVYLARGAHTTTKSGVIHFKQEEVAAAFAKGTGILATNSFKVQAGRREGPGEAEMHDTDTDIFYILEGSATFVTGGKLMRPRTIAAGETRAPEISGGETQTLTKGDIIVIPTKVPHWFKEVRGPFLYYVVKVEMKQRQPAAGITIYEREGRRVHTRWDIQTSRQPLD